MRRAPLEDFLITFADAAAALDVPRSEIACLPISYRIDSGGKEAGWASEIAVALRMRVGIATSRMHLYLLERHRAPVRS